MTAAARLPAASDEAAKNEGDVAEHVVLNVAETDDRELYDEIAARSGIRVFDTTGTQRESLRELRPAPAADVLEEPLRWVHYPWRHALVRVLGPAAFRLLRLDRNRNKITASEQNALSDLRVGVVGLSVGHAVAHTLAIEGLCGELRLADFDELDLSNLNRVPASLFDLDVNKSVVASRRIAELDPYLSVVEFQDGLTPETIDSFLDGLDIVIDECDSLDAKLTLRENARLRGIPVIMETSDGGILDVERFDVEPDRPLLHGLLGDLDASALRDITPAQKAPLAARILDPAKLTPRMLASVPEIGKTLSTWPQLGSDVALGGASVAAVVRSFGLGNPPSSGRVRINLDAHIAAIEDLRTEA
ncbi:hypothetical protein CH263_14185 [Rhodococcus sp. 06-1059B-a]|nr:Rv1355c family protein [Rhodococcus sp. 06-1059B-a]OZD64413.1 hypothetical protein CH263_14185 [Rhodococcus sp. 06-1059B-a]